MSRAYTAEEVRKMMLDQMRHLIKYWDKVGKDPADKLDGLCFSILNMFDGTTMTLPGMDIVLRPHESDKQYHIDNEQNYFEDGMVINNTSLHEEWYKNNSPVMAP